MKTTKKIILSVLMVCCLCFSLCLTGCDSDGNDNDSDKQLTQHELAQQVLNDAYTKSLEYGNLITKNGSYSAIPKVFERDRVVARMTWKEGYQEAIIDGDNIIVNAYDETTKTYTTKTMSFMDYAVEYELEGMPFAFVDKLYDLTKSLYNAYLTNHDGLADSDGGVKADESSLSEMSLTETTDKQGNSVKTISYKMRLAFVNGVECDVQETQYTITIKNGLVSSIGHDKKEYNYVEDAGLTLDEEGGFTIVETFEYSTISSFIFDKTQYTLAQEPQE